MTKGPLSGVIAALATRTSGFSISRHCHLQVTTDVNFRYSSSGMHVSVELRELVCFLCWQSVRIIELYRI